jgi:hypothetical protein
MKKLSQQEGEIPALTEGMLYNIVPRTLAVHETKRNLGTKRERSIHHSKPLPNNA